MSFANLHPGDQRRARGRLQLHGGAGRASQGALGTGGTALATQRDEGSPAAAAPGQSHSRGVRDACDGLRRRRHRISPCRASASRPDTLTNAATSGRNTRSPTGRFVVVPSGRRGLLPPRALQSVQAGSERGRARWHGAGCPAPPRKPICCVSHIICNCFIFAHFYC